MLVTQGGILLFLLEVIADIEGVFTFASNLNNFWPEIQNFILFYFFDLHDLHNINNCITVVG